MKREKVFLVFLFLLILTNLLNSICAAEEIPFLRIVYGRDIFVQIRDYIANFELLRCVFNLPSPKRSALFETMNEISRSIAKTQTCL